VSSVDKMEVEVKEERLAAATPRDMPYPISKEEKLDGWDTLINKYWLQCVTCERWRNVPKVVHDEVSCLHAAHPSLLSARCVTDVG
jgi:hypothetical protein